MHGLRLDYNTGLAYTAAPVPHSLEATTATPAAHTAEQPNTSSPTADQESPFSSSVQIYPWMKKLHVNCRFSLCIPVTNY